MSSVTDDDIHTYNAEKYRRYGDPGHGEFKYSGEEIDYGRYRAYCSESIRAERQNPTGKSCHHCFKDDVKLLRCSRCKEAFYCSRKCQKKNWKRAHRYICIACPPHSPTLIKTLDDLHQMDTGLRAYKHMMSQLYIGRTFVDEPSPIPVF